MKAEESIRDVATCDLQLFQHQQLWAEIVAHEETFAQAVAMGQRLQEQDIPSAQEVNIPLVFSYNRVTADAGISYYNKMKLNAKYTGKWAFPQFRGLRE